MNRVLFYTAGVFLLLTASALVGLSIWPASDKGAVAVPPLLEGFRNSTSAEIQGFRSDVQSIARDVRQTSSVVSSVASERTPTPPAGPFTFQIVDAVRVADERREIRLRPALRQLDLLSQQLVDLQQRATTMEIRIQDAIRDLSDRIMDVSKTRGGSQRIDTIVALVGILCSLATLGVAVHKETRESREAKLKIRELELKLMQGNTMPVTPAVTST